MPSPGLDPAARQPRARGQAVDDRRSFDAIVVLGCRVRLDHRGRLCQDALAHRVDAAALTYANWGGERTIVVASGGRHWRGLVEADVMARELAWRGVPEHAIVRERSSLSTCDNAHFTAAALARRGIGHVAVVTSAWHVARAVALFHRAGVRAEGVAAKEQEVPWTSRAWRWGRERLLIWVQTALAMLAAAACSRSTPAASAPQDAATALDTIDLDIEMAQDLRRAKDVPAEGQTSRDPAVRRRTARAFARILDGDDTPLLRALEDDDEETTAWGAFGLGESCQAGREESHVRVLAARLASLEANRVRASLDARVAIVRALGRCGGDLSEETLRALLRRGRDLDGTSAVLPRRGRDLDGTSAVLPRRGRDLGDAVAYAFGDLAARRRSLSVETADALLDAAQRSPPLDAALYPFGRVEGPAGDELELRLLAAARMALGRSGPERIFAVRALGRTTRSEAALELSRVLESDDFAPAERAEAARALGHMHEMGQVVLADTLPRLLHDGSGVAGDRFGVLLAAVTSLGENAPKSAETALWALANAELAAGSPAAIARRISALRCAAAEKLARGSWDSEVLVACDLADGEAGERARLTALERGQLVKARRRAWLELARQTHHPRVRETALDAIGLHPELGDAAPAVLADALAAVEPGVVATAASVVHAHPERVYVLADREKRTAPDPRAPPPTANPARELDPRVAAALRAAMAHRWTEDLVETRAALVDAALAVGLDEAHSYAQVACRDANVTMRTRAAVALAAAGDAANCQPPDTSSNTAPEIGHVIGRPTRVVLDTDGGTLGITFDPRLAPIAATRFVALARSGFYDGISVHRVVPGFVVQLGDRGGDGYGGAGSLLRCETSPVPFGALDVGVALAGRDTGSSQLFVALARYPHLDGQYAWVGRADGDWNSIAEGDLVHQVHVEE